MSRPAIVSLKCPAQNYAWGKKGRSSAVAVLGYSGSESSIDEEQPYAELWMGTHFKGPAVLSGDGKTTLRDHIGQDLPYLFKVLSIAKCLSIQAHPDKKLAEKLHADRPDVYRDPNHKPELACAVTTFEAMCGFRLPSEIADNLDKNTEFANLLGENEVKSFTEAIALYERDQAEDGLKTALKRLFTVLMNADPDKVKAQLANLVSRLEQEEDGKSDPNEEIKSGQLYLPSILLRLNSQYPGDVGVFCPFVLNTFKCQSGDAVFLPANEPHAYISGDIIEVMACSDNVVRAGCTPKLRDVDTLCSMLTYKARCAPIDKGVTLDDYSVAYAPPIDEFFLTKTVLPPGEKYTLAGVQGPALVLVYEGEGAVVADRVDLSIQKGSIIFVESGKDTAWTSSGSSNLVLFRCHAPLYGKSSKI